MGPIGCPETKVTNYQSMLFNIAKKKDLIYTTAETWNHADNTNILEKPDVSTLYHENKRITHFKTMVPIHQVTWLNILQGHNINKLDF